MQVLKTTLFLVCLSLTQQAATTMFKYEGLNPYSGGALGGELLSVTGNFDDTAGAQKFGWSAQFDPAAGVNSFQLVLNNGPNPKQSDSRELAIMYGNLDASTWNDPGTAMGKQISNGVAFDDDFGIWFHFANGFSYNGDLINGYDVGRQGWYDKSWRETTRVPTPGTLALMGLGLLGLVARRCA